MYADKSRIVVTLAALPVDPSNKAVLPSVTVDNELPPAKVTLLASLIPSSAPVAAVVTAAEPLTVTLIVSMSVMLSTKEPLTIVSASLIHLERSYSKITIF